MDLRSKTKYVIILHECLKSLEVQWLVNFIVKLVFSLSSMIFANYSVRSMIYITKCSSCGLITWIFRIGFVTNILFPSCPSCLLDMIFCSFSILLWTGIFNFHFFIWRFPRCDGASRWLIIQIIWISAIIGVQYRFLTNLGLSAIIGAHYRFLQNWCFTTIIGAQYRSLTNLGLSAIIGAQYRFLQNWRFTTIVGAEYRFLQNLRLTTIHPTGWSQLRVIKPMELFIRPGEEIILKDRLKGL